MSVSVCAVEDDLQFPAFLTREHQPSAPVGGVPCNGIKARARGLLWGAGARFLRLLCHVVSPLTWWRGLKQPRELSFVEIEDMSRNGAGLAGPGGGHPSPMAPVLEDGIMKAAVEALNTFRAVEGEKALNMLLHELLIKSNDNLARYGVRGAFRETAELESLRAQLKGAQEANRRGTAEYRALQHAANQVCQDIANIAQQVAPDSDVYTMVRESLQAWEAATAPDRVTN